MKRLFTKFLSILLLGAITLQMLPAVYGAGMDYYNEYLPEAEDFSWSLEGGVLTVSGNGAMPQVSPMPWADSSAQIERAVVGEGITTVGYGAFSECTNLVSISLPGSLVIIRDSAFYGCTALGEIDIPDSVEYIGSYAFEKCSALSELALTNGDITLAQGAFAGSGLKRITLPQGLTHVWQGAFEACRLLEEVAIPDSVTAIGAHAFSGCSALKEIALPERLTQIGEGAFQQSGLTDIDIPASVASVGEFSFSECRSLASVRIADGVEKIGEYAFRMCDSLTKVSIHDSLQSIGGGAFSDCVSLSSVDLPDGLEEIGASAFSHTALTAVTLPVTLESLGSGAFESTQLTNVTVPGEIAHFGTGVFTWCLKLSDVTFAPGNTIIPDATFYGCDALVQVDIPDSVREIGGSAFRGAGLSSLTLPDTVESIGALAFCECERLTDFTLPDSLCSIGDNAFSYCASLESIDIPDGAEYLGEGVFSNCGALKSVTLPASLAAIPEDMFYDCAALEGVDIPQTVTAIGDGAFAGCESISALTLPDGVTLIGRGAFSRCTALASLSLPEGVRAVEEYTFSECTSLESVYIPRAVTVIGEMAFNECASLTSIELPSALESFGYRAVYGCAALQRLDIPEGVTGLWGYDSFGGCTSLTRLTLPMSVTEIEDGTILPSESLTLYGVAGSAAQLYAGEHGIPFESLGNIPLALSVKDADGTLLTDRVSVSWYSNGALIGRGAEIGVAEGISEAVYKVELPEELAFTYYTPGAQSVSVSGDGGSYALTLEKIPYITLTGTVQDTDGTSVDGANITLVQRGGGYEKTIGLTTGDDGAFSASILNIPTDIIVEKDGYFKRNIVLISHREQGSAFTAATVALTPMPERRIHMSFTVREPAREAQTGYEYRLVNTDTLTFTVYNESRGQEVDSHFEYPYLIPDGTEVQNGDILRITAQDAAGSMRADDAFVTFSGTDNTAQVLFVKNGAAQAVLRGGGETLAMAFDENGKCVDRLTVSGASYTSSCLPDGGYTFVFMEHSVLLGTVAHLSDLDALGLVRGSGYVTVTANIESGVISDMGTFTVPTLDESVLYYTDMTFTGVSVSAPDAVAGRAVMLRAQYRLKDGAAADCESVVIKLPQGAELIDGSITLDGKSVSAVTDGDTVSVAVSKKEGTVRMYAVFTEEGQFSLDGYLCINCGTESVTQPIGSAPISVTLGKLSAPSVVNDGCFTVSGRAAPASGVSLYCNGIKVGQCQANGAGSWQTQVSLPDTSWSLQYCRLYAVIDTPYGVTVKTATAETEYNADAVKPTKLTAIHGGNVIEIDYTSPKATVPVYSFSPTTPSFTFIIEFPQGAQSALEQVYALTEDPYGKKKYVLCTYDENTEAYIGSSDYDSYTLPAKITVAYNEKSEYTDIARTDTMTEFYTEMLSAVDDASMLLEDTLTTGEVVEDVEGVLSCVLTLSADGGEVSAGEVRLEYLDWSLFSLDEFSGSAYERVTFADGEEYYSKSEYTGNQLVTLYAFPQDETYIKVTLTLGDINTYSLRSMPDFFELTNSLAQYLPGWAGELAGGINTAGDMVIYKNRIDGYKDILCTLLDSYCASLFSAKCKDTGEPRLTPSQIATFTAEAQILRQEIDGYCSSALKRIAGTLLAQVALDKAVGKLTDKVTGKIADKLYTPEQYKYYEKIHRAYLKLKTSPSDPAYKEIATMAIENAQMKDVVDFANQYYQRVGIDLAGDVSGMGDALSFMSVFDTEQWIEAGYNSMNERIDTFRDEMIAALKKCGEDEDIPTPLPDREETPNDLKYSIDPSGYVYEAVPSNRLEGVKAQAYYYDYPLDEYGTPAQEMEEILWDASEYDQVNPVYTDSLGRYAWDVPMGRWVVRFSKEGYYDTDSKSDPAADEEGYLPVPPPQTEVNTAMVSKAAPTVKSVNVHGDEVELIFSQYMDIGSVNTSTVSVVCGGQSVTGSISPSDAEYNYEQTEMYASVFVFTPEIELSGSVQISVDNVINYAGTRTEGKHTVEEEVSEKPERLTVKERVDVAYNGGALLEVQILPASAGAGKTLSVHSSCPEIAGAVNTVLTADENGVATVMLEGRLPGSAQLTFTLDGSTLQTYTVAKVGAVDSYEGACEKVSADIPTGTSVKSGTPLTLSTGTAGATIYYTLDGSCPCEEGNPARKEYTDPIVLTEDSFIIAYAVKKGLKDSVTAGFTYTVEKAAGPAYGDFTDLESGRFYSDAVEYVLEKSIMNGVSATTFEPNTATNRGMLVTVLYRLEGAPVTDGMEEHSFVDVEQGRYYSDAITWAYNTGVVNGISATSFAPDSAVTREQFATILYRYADSVKGMDVTFGSATLDAFKDRDKVSAFARDALTWASYTGLVTGFSDGNVQTLRPADGTTRAQMATILYRFITK